MSKDIKKKELLKRIYQLSVYTKSKFDLINNMTDDTATNIYREMKDILLKGSFKETSKQPPAEWKPVLHWENEYHD